MTSIRRRILFRLLAAAMTAQFGPAVALATETDPKTVSPVETAETSHSGLEMRALTEEARQYCVNIRDVAADARYAWQKSTLEELDKRLAERIAALEAKRAEYETWLKKREDFLAAARDDVVAIYAKMRPEAAAGQLTALDDDMAAAVLARLNARASSAILNEMEPARASQLASTLAGMTELSAKGDTP
jgi:flagellar motility protein MotE (MotC chaperone)